jgi:hypothetical protein
VARRLQYRAPAPVPAAADALGLRRRLRGPCPGVEGLLGGAEGRDPEHDPTGRTHIIDVADLGGRSARSRSLAAHAAALRTLRRFDPGSRVETEVLAVAFSADGRRFGAATLGGRVYVWDIGSKQPVGDVGATDGRVADLLLSPDLCWLDVLSRPRPRSGSFCGSGYFGRTERLNGPMLCGSTRRSTWSCVAIQAGSACASRRSHSRISSRPKRRPPRPSRSLACRYDRSTDMRHATGEPCLCRMLEGQQAGRP